MLERVTRWLFFAWFAAVAALSWRACRHGWTLGTGLGLYLLVLGHPTLLAIEFALSRRIGASAGAPPMAWQAWVGAWRREWIVSTVVFGWRAPWRANAYPDHLPKSSRGLRGVVFVHGFVCNRGLWNPWLKRLARLDRAFVAVSLEPVFGEIDGYAAAIEQAVRRVEAVTGLAPVIVAHSMGGLVVRAWLRAREASGGARHGHEHEHVARVITIGTPHRGTWLARMALSPNGKQMRIGSPWMTGLARAEAPDRGATFSCWWSGCDQIVFPPPTAVLPGSEPHHLRGVGHLALTEREEIWTELRRRIDD